MTAARKREPISVEAYLEGELHSTVKHEYLAGAVFAMAGARLVHNDIAVNVVSNLYARLRGKSCRPQNSDVKIRIDRGTRTSLYYPDASVVCDSNPKNLSYQDKPVVIVEVVSPGTRRIDEYEKKDAYLTIPSLQVYLLVEQDLPLVIAHRRTDAGWIREVYDGLPESIPLPEIDADLPLAEIYSDVVFPETTEEETPEER